MSAYAGAGARLAEVTIPALIIHGRDDRHWPQVEHAVEVAHVIANFIGDQS